MSVTGEEIATPRPGTRRRIPFLAVVFALLSPIFGMLYLGRPLRAAFYFLLGWIAIIGVALLAWVGWWPAGLSWLPVVVVIRGICSADAYRIAKQYASTFAGPSYTTWYGLTIIAAVLIATPLSIRAFIFVPFRQPSGSMLPTLLVDEQFFVSKLAYRNATPERGDIVVFQVPGTNIYFVKRIIGLPGDVVDYDAAERRLTVNGRQASLETLGAYDADPQYRLDREQFEGREHQVLHRPQFPSAGGLYRVPDGHYFMLGDNRDNSEDSRFPRVGYIPSENIVGKVSMIWWNADEPKRAGIVPE